MTNRMKSRFLMTTAALLAGVSLAAAQSPSGRAGGDAGREKGMSQSAPGASHSEGMTQGRATESREGSRAEESGRAQREERGRAEGPRDSAKDQTVGQARPDRDDMRHSQDSS